MSENINSLKLLLEAEQNQHKKDVACLEIQLHNVDDRIKDKQSDIDCTKALYEAKLCDLRTEYEGEKIKYQQALEKKDEVIASVSDDLAKANGRIKRELASIERLKDVLAQRDSLVRELQNRLSEFEKRYANRVEVSATNQQRMMTQIKSLNSFLLETRPRNQSPDSSIGSYRATGINASMSMGSSIIVSPEQADTKRNSDNIGNKIVSKSVNLSTIRKQGDEKGNNSFTTTIPRTTSTVVQKSGEPIKTNGKDRGRSPLDLSAKAYSSSALCSPRSARSFSPASSGVLIHELSAHSGTTESQLLSSTGNLRIMNLASSTALVGDDGKEDALTAKSSDMSTQRLAERSISSSRPSSSSRRSSLYLDVTGSLSFGKIRQADNIFLHFKKLGKNDTYVANLSKCSNFQDICLQEIGVNVKFNVLNSAIIFVMERELKMEKLVKLLLELKEDCLEGNVPYDVRLRILDDRQIREFVNKVELAMPITQFDPSKIE